MTYAFAVLMVAVALALAYARRRHWAETATILIVALPVVLWVPRNAPHWARSLRHDYRLGPSAALELVPRAVPAKPHRPLARLALSAIPMGETYAVVAHPKAPPRSAAARRERARLKYFESWLQYWLAPRIQVNPADARWLIVLDASGRPPPTAGKVHRIGTDLLVQR